MRLNEIKAAVKGNIVTVTETKYYNLDKIIENTKTFMGYQRFVSDGGDAGSRHRTIKERLTVREGSFERKLNTTDGEETSKEYMFDGGFNTFIVKITDTRIIGQLDKLIEVYSMIQEIKDKNLLEV